MTTSAMRVLITASWYPSFDAPGRGVFIADQATALARSGIAVDVASWEVRVRYSAPTAQTDDGGEGRQAVADAWCEAIRTRGRSAAPLAGVRPASTPSGSLWPRRGSEVPGRPPGRCRSRRRGPARLGRRPALPVSRRSSTPMSGSRTGSQRSRSPSGSTCPLSRPSTTAPPPHGSRSRACVQRTCRSWQKDACSSPSAMSLRDRLATVLEVDPARIGVVPNVVDVDAFASGRDRRA